MASENKITIRVATARRTQTIRWSSVGQEGSVNMSQTTGQLTGIPLSDMSDSDAYWKGILTLVQNAILP